LNLLADWGVVGGIIVLAGIGIFIFWLKKTWPYVRREENDFGSGQSNRFAFFLGAVSGLAALAVHSAMDFNLHIPANALVGVTLLALVASNARFATERFWFCPNRSLTLVFTAALGGVAIYFAVQAWRLGGEAYWQAQAETLPLFSPARENALEKAFACEPKNFATAYEIGECCRMQSQEGGDSFTATEKKALDWYAQALRLDPHDGYSLLRTGMCLDWLGQHAEAEPAYRAAEVRDPNGYFMVANIGWHYVQTGDYAAAQAWFARSLMLSDKDNAIAANYQAICESKLAEKASGRPQLPSGF
jgi:tetratricopeptide (TPR) repeat protein